MSEPTYVIVPGYGDSGPGHWQSLWEPQLPSVRVRQDDPEDPWPLPWAARLEEVIAATPGPLVLVAHSCGVLTALTWAREYPAAERVRGAFLVAPPDAEQPNMPQLSAQTHEEVICASAFGGFQTWRLAWEERWPVEGVVGFQHSASFAAPHLWEVGWTSLTGC